VVFTTVLTPVRGFIEYTIAGRVIIVTAGVGRLASAEGLASDGRLRGKIGQ